MRTLRLARVAAEAEGLLLRRRVRSAAIRAGLGVIAALFLIGAVAMLHVYAWVMLRPLWSAPTTALALTGLDAAIAIVVGLFAARTPVDPIASQAIQVRDKAVAEMRSVFTLGAMLRPLTGLLFEQWLLRRRRKP
jgi:NADH:ubiquinone oxidoreductase subunit 6 (subunit J)